MEKVFVYGTLKPGEINHQLYCADKVIETVRAYTQGRLFNLPLGYPAMSTGSSRVEGFLLVFPDSSILASLDDLEDYHPQRPPQKNEYYRQKTLVYQLSGRSLGLAWSYFMTQEKIEKLGGVEVASGWWTGTHSSS